MAAVTDVTIAAGVPTVGTGTVATLSKFEKAASSGGPAASDVALAVTIRDVNANGTTTDANSTPVAWSTEAKAQVGSLTETAPASDTASSGLNGRLQRIAQRLTSTIALLPTALGANGGLKIEGVASGTTVPVTNTAVATEVHLGEIGGKSTVFAVALSTDTSAYASGDLIADTQQMDAFFRKTDGTGVINSITIIDQDAQGVALYVLFMSTSTSLGTENSAPNISDANLTTGLQGIVAVATTDYVTVSGTKVATIRNIGLPVKAVSGTDDIYIAVLNATGTPTFTATGLNMKIQALLD